MAVILSLLIVAVVVTALWRASQPRNPSSTPGPSRRERDLSVARGRYLDGTLSLEEFEREAADALDPKPREYSERIEVHVWDAPAGSALHIHLPWRASQTTTGPPCERPARG